MIQLLRSSETAECQRRTAMKKRTVMITLMSVMMGLCALTGYADILYGNNSSQAYTGPDGRYYVDASYSVPVTPVYVFYNAYMRDYFWTTSATEANSLEREFNEGRGNYRYYGIDGFAEETASDRNTPVYRFWNEKTSDHFYTISEDEKEQLQKNLETGEDNYEYEGIAWYAPINSGKPVYRFFDIVSFDHYYTSNEDEKTRLAAEYYNGTGNFRYEGIAWYWFE